ncbi:MAG: sugar ABC transporter ATP-binding protein [Planctomycetota bacterium]|jgi:inositol transport system ATP-binding protein|nr:sugar ABC transporter ATP-binding protein [Planctomycetota bacterium]
MTGVPKLELLNVRKAFPGVVALSDVNFAVERGTVHVLCGENGAGKSTLMKILDGIYRADEGEIRIDGGRVEIKSPEDARARGIAMIFQELNFVPEMTVEEHLFLGIEPTRGIPGFRRVDWGRIREGALGMLAAEGLPYRPDVKLRHLSVSDIQMLEITKAVSRDADILIMDEPTSAITTREVDGLMRKIDELRKKGLAIIYISHKMDEIFRIADQITILRDGAVVESRPASELDIDRVISLMVGRTITNVYPKEPVEPGEVVFEARNLTRSGVFEEVSFNVRAGEIVGFAGLVGAGRTEVARAIFGLDPLDSGRIFIRGVEAGGGAVRDSMDAGVVMLSEDRRRYGIIPMRSVRENAALGNLAKFIYGGRLHAAKERRAVAERFMAIDVKTPSLETPIQSLSGGNQQKVLLSKWLLAEPRVLFMDEPTRGIDVGAKFEIYKIMVGLARQGKGLIMISSELPELLGMCDRVYVMGKGRIRGELAASRLSQEEVMRLATLA